MSDDFKKTKKEALTVTVSACKMNI